MKAGPNEATIKRLLLMVNNKGRSMSLFANYYKGKNNYISTKYKLMHGKDVVLETYAKKDLIIKLMDIWAELNG